MQHCHVKNTCTIVELMAQKAAKGGHLDSHTYLRQNLGLAVAGTMTLIYLWKTPAGVMEPVYQK